MSRRNFVSKNTLRALICALIVATRASATGVPVSGFAPLVGIGLSIEDNIFDDERDDFDTAAVSNESQPTNTIMLGSGGTPHYDFALLDTGAGFSAITLQAYNAFNLGAPRSGNSDGFHGTESIGFDGATGTLTADINDPLGLYAAGVQTRVPNSSLVMNLNTMKGQLNTSMLTFREGSDLPNILGFTFASRYTTYIRNDQPQLIEIDGRTVRTPAVEFRPIGDGKNLGLLRRAFVQLAPSGVTSSPTWFYNIGNFLDGSWIDIPQEDPSQPTLLGSGNGGAFLTVVGADNVGTHGPSGDQLGATQFLFDTGADVTVVSSQTAGALGYNGIPEFTVAVVGSGGTAFGVPGFFVDSLSVDAITDVGGAANDLTLSNVPVIILDVLNPANTESILPGIIGTNMFAGRNIALDPRTSSPGSSLYIGEPVTNQKNWTTTSASGTFGIGTNWNGSTTPTNLSVANVRFVSGTNQTAVVAATTTVWELNVSGNASHTMTVQIQNGITLQTFSGTNIELGGGIQLMSNSTLDTHYVEMLGGTLTGAGSIETGSGPIPGQVENRGGIVAPGNGVGTMNILGRFANGPGGTLAFELGGHTLGQFDQIIVDGGVTLDGTLNISFANSYTPGTGDSFALITSTDDLGGTFSNLQLPSGYEWDVDYDTHALILTVLSAGLPGDFNHDNKVDSADYVVWRKTGMPAQKYTEWVNNYGRSQMGGGGGETSVPEPGAIALMLIAAGALISQRRRRVA